jgi:hypothetical protein
MMVHAVSTTNNDTVDRNEVLDKAEVKKST